MASRDLIEQILRTIDDSTAAEHDHGQTAPEGSALWMWHHDADFHQSMEMFAYLIGHMARGVFEGSKLNAASRRLMAQDFKQQNRFRVAEELMDRIRVVEDEFIDDLPSKIEVVMDTTPLLPSIQEAMRRHPARGEG